MKIWAIILTATLALTTVLDADAARRLGGGKSFGRQSNNVTQREATPAAPAAPVQNNAAAARPNTPAAAPAAAAPKRPWGAMLGGLAAGLGLAWLANSLGLGAAFGQFMLIALLVLVAMVAVGWFMRRRQAASAAPVQRNSPFAFQGAGDGSPAYRPENVGNDASARPFERQNTAFESAGARRHGRQRRDRPGHRLGADRFAVLGRARGFRRSRFPARREEQLRDPAVRLGRCRHRLAALDDDRRHAEGNPVAADRA